MQRPMFAAAIALLCALTAHADLLIENVTVVSPDQAQPSANRHVLVRGERIAEISAKPIAVSGETRRIDGRGRFLTPGIMDSHVHVVTPPGLPLNTDDKTIAALGEAYAIQQPRSYLYFGVTQVLDLVGLPEGIARFKAQPVRPDFFRCGAVVVLDGYPTVWVDKSQRYKLLPDYVYEPANAATHPLPAGEDPAKHTPEAVVSGVAASDARCVKIFIEDGFGPRTDWPLMSMPTLKRVVAEAHKHQLPVVAHANALDMQRMAVDAGVDVLAHGLWNWNEFDESAGVPEAIAAHLRRIQAQKIGYQPTLRVLPGTADLFRKDTLEDPSYAKVVPPELLAWYATEAGGWFKKEIQRDFGDMPESKIAQVQLRVGERGMRAVRYLAQLGHPLLLASDTPSAPTYGNQPGYDTYREMRLMKLSGVSLPAILEAATINNARQFGLDRDYGTVERGKIANLLLLKSNPLESIDAWSKIDRVILRGAALERESLAAGRSAPQASVGPTIHIEDVERFYRIYGAAGGHPTADELQRNYLDPGSDGLHQFAKMRRISGAAIAETLVKRPEIYSGARRCMDVLPAVRQRAEVSLRTLGRLYPEAKFPPVTIAVGRGKPVAVGSPVSGVQIGLEALCATDWLNPDVEDRFVHVIAHEYAHVQQVEALVDDEHPTVLSMSLIEGAAEFIAELISGEVSMLYLKESPMGREKELETEFVADVDKTDISAWLYNSTPEQPRDLGYWVGYRIVKSYYQHANDKRQALREIIQMSDPKAFLGKSGWSPGIRLQ